MTQLTTNRSALASSSGLRRGEDSHGAVQVGERADHRQRARVPECLPTFAVSREVLGRRLSDILAGFVEEHLFHEAPPMTFMEPLA